MREFKASMKMLRHEIVSSKDDIGIEVVSGCVWLTHLGCPKDWILESGDRALVSAARQSVIYALSESEIWVESQARSLRVGERIWGASGA
jgi:hypothetical protein